jgi:hypothetical protein
MRGDGATSSVKMLGSRGWAEALWPRSCASPFGFASTSPRPHGFTNTSHTIQVRSLIKDLPCFGAEYLPQHVLGTDDGAYPFAVQNSSFSIEVTHEMQFGSAYLASKYRFKSFEVMV